MPSRNLYQFDIEGIETMILTLDKIEEEMFKKIDIALTKLAEKVIEDAKKLAGLDSGDLEASLVVGEVKKMLQRIYIDFGTSPEVDDYAMVQHEGFRKTKTGKVVYMSPGEKTQSKGPHRGYMPGKKFLENAIKINEKLIEKELAPLLRF
ncbi:HK97 gp10 family phage protein [Mesobacillus subterraneus]|uniref:HK97 gp10 family phage protein n=1 Tax=Mesobacillus subterraneus TaxID=285983 RepID=UPI00203E3FA8|nr:HK97 gp10 family phage protein [Mesobacillus subterraneus]MCM3573282.1 HK97 gp10 family phage protein [Mesobacillus subterraneus]